MKYLLVKGWMGFGDRLQSLKMCVKFAMKHNVPMLVEWEDNIWSHGLETFYKYFKLDIPTFKLEDVPPNASIYPPFWKGRLHMQLDQQIIDKNHAQLCIQRDGHNMLPCQEDVLVFSCYTNRLVYNDSTFFVNVFKIIHPEVLRKVKERNDKYNLEKKIGIHLRGTDRATKLDKRTRMNQLNVRMISEGFLNGQEFIVVSDDPEYVKLWQNKYKFPVLTNIDNMGGTEGTHNIDYSNLKVSKEMMNVDLLVDFCTLALCKRSISTSKDSRFSQEAERFRLHIKRILG
jgi:hypothetical protein